MGIYKTYTKDAILLNSESIQQTMDWFGVAMQGGVRYGEVMHGVVVCLVR